MMDLLYTEDKIFICPSRCLTSYRGGLEYTSFKHWDMSHLPRYPEVLKMRYELPPMADVIKKLATLSAQMNKEDREDVRKLDLSICSDIETIQILNPRGTILVEM